MPLCENMAPRSFMLSSCQASQLVRLMLVRIAILRRRSAAGSDLRKLILKTELDGDWIGKHPWRLLPIHSPPFCSIVPFTAVADQPWIPGLLGPGLPAAQPQLLPSLVTLARLSLFPRPALHRPIEWEYIILSERSLVLNLALKSIRQVGAGTKGISI